MPDFRSIPKVDALSRSLAADAPEGLRLHAARQAVRRMRAALESGDTVEIGAVQAWAEEALADLQGPGIRPMINASGVVLHTGLGRARLPRLAVEAVAAAAGAHCAVEFDLESGERGDRQSHVREHLQALTGCADALVVNNGAGAVFLSLAALAAGRGVLLSRGQMVEIGGSFRMPEIVRQSGCELIEVGCTNKTHLADYDVADTNVAAILRCHRSNFSMSGFVEEPSTAELAALAHRRGWHVVDDVGSGALLDLSTFGLAKETTLRESLEAGADVVVSSGDKLLGGPQAGLILGSRACIDAIRKHPLARALRVDKLTLAALEATLRLAVTEQWLDIPTIWAIRRPVQDLEPVARMWQEAFGDAVVEQGETEIGGGSAPGSVLPTWRTGLVGASPHRLAALLRQGKPGIVGRIEQNRLWLDPRTVTDEEAETVTQVLARIGK